MSAFRHLFGGGLVDQAQRLRLGGIDETTSGEHFKGRFAWDRAGEGDHGRGAEQADVHPVDAEFRSIRSDGHIAGGHKLAARSGGNAMDLRDNRLRQGLDPVHQRRTAGEERVEGGRAAIIGLSRGLHFFEVVTRAEGLAGT